ncbi:MAG: nickel pincer cofactor biosynthesis protein LarB [Candidatus Omnitrophica bacterium]|nr:nickel pincer cofactor biosynthesis protein LarB [Candidatus Omnitrophota bacterium]
MDRERLVKALEEVRNGTLDIDAALQLLKGFPFEDLDFARIDHHRSIRTGFPEVIFAGGKTIEQTVAIFGKLAERSDRVLATRVAPDCAEALLKEQPEATYFPLSLCVTLDRRVEETRTGNILVVCAGTSDLAVAEEAAITADLMGGAVHRINDAGVAGIHRILSEGEALSKARVVIVAAGMEGALPSVVGGLVSVPVIAVPTSVGYGASFGGVAALLGMLNTCASGVSVVNIDNGFGAGYQAALINRLPEMFSEKE